MSLTINSYPNNPRVFKALIAAEYNGVKIDYPKDFKFGVDNKTEAFLKKNPTGKVPSLDAPEGTIFESNAIARYVARLGHAKLYGANVFESGLVDQWIDWTANTVDPAVGAWLGPIFGYLPYKQADTQKAKDNLKAALTLLDNHLSTRTYLVGERVSLADIVVSMSLYWPYEHVFDAKFREPFVNLNRWFTTLIHKKEFKAVIGELKLCEQAKEYKPPAKEEKKKEEKPKEEKKKEEKPKKNEDEEEEEEKPKAKNPLDLLPPSKLVLDEWKRFYSNNESADAQKWFWEHFDAEGYSIFFSRFKYNEENDRLFKTNNAINGFFQRLELLHKYAFASVVVLGEDAPAKHEIRACWLFRGKDVAPAMKACDDFELYTWEAADVNDEATRKRVDAYWSWDQTIDNLPFLGGKVFK